MPDLQRITTQYIEVEDRLRLTGELAPGEVVVLWLTQRLMHRLIGHLCRSLDDPTPHLPHSRRLQADVIQSFAQQAARAQLPAQPAVQASPASQQWLVAAIDISQAPDKTTLTFKGSLPNGQARLTLQEQPLRQWLSIVFEQCTQAGWPVAVWPDWVKEASQPSQDQPTLLQ